MESSETLQGVAQGCCGCHLPGGVERHVGQSIEQPRVVEHVLALEGGFRTR